MLRRLRADARTRDIPVVILSADATRQRIDQLRTEGVVDYLTKPIDVRGLLHTLDCALGEDAARAGRAGAARAAGPARVLQRALLPSDPRPCPGRLRGLGREPRPASAVAGRGAGRGAGLP